MMIKMLKNIFQWQRGRQLSGYDKMLLCIFPLPRVWVDMYLLKFKKGSKIPPHTDRVDKYRHYRLNIVLKKAKSGGEFICDKSYVNMPRVKFFRSDMMEHSVTEVLEGTRYLLSIGIAIKSE